MTRKSCGWLVGMVMVVGMLLPLGVLQAAEANRGGDRGRTTDRQRGQGGAQRDRGDRRARFATLRRAMEKQRNGEELTQEEKDAVARVQRFRAAAAGGAQPGGRMGANAKPGIATLDRLTRDDRLNVIDDAYVSIAEVQISQKKYDKAVEALERLATRSPDKLAGSLAHLNLAEVYRKELSNKERAIAEYKKVTGEYALEAQSRLASLFEELDQIDEAVATFEAFAKATPDKMQKVLALRELAELLFRSKRADEAVAVLQRLTEVVTYDEAKEISKGLQEAEARQEKVAREQQDRERATRFRNLANRFRGRGAQRPGGDAGMRANPALEARPQGNKGAEPVERPIRPDAEE